MLLPPPGPSQFGGGLFFWCKIIATLPHNSGYISSNRSRDALQNRHVQHVQQCLFFTGFYRIPKYNLTIEDAIQGLDKCTRIH